jgi:hypothetical protein
MNNNRGRWYQILDTQRYVEMILNSELFPGEMISLATEFSTQLHADPAARNKFVLENYQNAIWIVEEPTYCDYGIPIPGAEVYAFPLAEVWFNPCANGWIVRYPGVVWDKRCGVYQSAISAKAAAEQIIMKWVIKNSTVTQIAVAGSDISAGSVVCKRDIE